MGRMQDVNRASFETEGEGHRKTRKQTRPEGAIGTGPSGISDSWKGLGASEESQTEETWEGEGRARRRTRGRVSITDATLRPQEKKRSELCETYLWCRRGLFARRWRREKGDSEPSWTGLLRTISQLAAAVLSCIRVDVDQRGGVDETIGRWNLSPLGRQKTSVGGGCDLERPRSTMAGDRTTGLSRPRKSRFLPPFPPWIFGCVAGPGNFGAVCH